MALIYNGHPFSGNSRRHATSSRRQTTTDKYGYPVTTLGSSSYSNGMHVLRVQPGVVVNFIEPPSSSSRGRSWRTPRTVEYNSSRKDHGSDHHRDSSWTMTHSPHPRSLDLFDDRGPPHPFDGFEAPPPQELCHAPPHHYIPEEHFADPYYSEPHYPEPHYIDSHYPESHYPEAHFSVEHHESPRHAPSPIDIPTHPHPSDYPAYTLHSPSLSSSDSHSFHHDHPGEPYYRDARHSPTHMPIQIVPSGRPRSHSFDLSSGKPPSPLSSSNTRTVRFKDDPVLPSPPVRRKGWWNRKGDQLWDNDGAYAAAPEHDQYPPDLRGYPEPGTGWMNEEGTHIDMKRRLVRKKPLRSALKKSSSL